MTDIHKRAMDPPPTLRGKMFNPLSFNPVVSRRLPWSEPTRTEGVFQISTNWYSTLPRWRLQTRIAVFGLSAMAIPLNKTSMPLLSNTGTVVIAIPVSTWSALHQRGTLLRQMFQVPPHVHSPVVWGLQRDGAYMTESHCTYARPSAHPERQVTYHVNASWGDSRRLRFTYSWDKPHWVHFLTSGGLPQNGNRSKCDVRLGSRRILPSLEIQNINVVARISHTSIPNQTISERTAGLSL